MLATSAAVIEPSVLLSVPFLALGAALGIRRPGVILIAALAAGFVAVGGERDGLWYAERGWALLVAAGFTAATLRRPGATFAGRALVAVSGAAAFTALLLGIRTSEWIALDASVRARLDAGVEAALETFRMIGGGTELSPAVVTAVRQTGEAQATLFPAMLAIASMAGLGVTWWLYVRLAAGNDQGLGPLRGFRFNDHLVWVFIGGLVLFALRWGDAAMRVGANVVVFMGALYAVRGAAVIVFLSGGLSALGFFLVAVGLVFVPPLVLAGAMVIGIGDTWLDVRSKRRRRVA
jgi:hypothetical protein